ncbi:MAG TPA: hypothetical protein H9669_02630 [Firmicutes bacterium]|nr:hypothetical protein [Bacillota bacterium]
MGQNQTSTKKSRLIRTPRKLSVAETYITIAFMLCALIVLYAIVGWDLKITLLLVLAFNVFMGWRIGTPFKTMEKYIGDRIGSLGFFMLVLLGIGFLMATCICSGTIPVLISWLVQCVSPSIVLLLCLILPSILSVAVISSFATLGTLGSLCLALQLCAEFRRAWPQRLVSAVQILDNTSLL